ncbi:hypothetical protein BB561_001684 [Smittium simulii]|uniref:Uncharacterized protein n=1 Tax=Smittium simulii TaxID=133385 RepID=A0A2T9YTI0_9FUNG|nr:hypothetical protein BB561_001684 [Smittium simulii]
MSKPNSTEQGKCLNYPCKYEDHLIKTLFKQTKEDIDDLAQNELLQRSRFSEAKRACSNEQKLEEINNIKQAVAQNIIRLEDIEKLVLKQENNLEQIEKTVVALENVFEIRPNTPISVTEIINNVADKFGGETLKTQHKPWIPPSIKLPKLD